MSTPTDTRVKPVELTTDVFTVCMTRPRRCERVEAVRCLSCGWRAETTAAEQGETMALFGSPDSHDADECTRRQLDPEYARAEDHARLRRAGLDLT